MTTILLCILTASVVLFFREVTLACRNDALAAKILAAKVAECRGVLDAPDVEELLSGLEAR